MAVIRPADNKKLCHKSSQKTKAVRLIFAHCVRARTVCCSEGTVSFLFLFLCVCAKRLKLIEQSLNISWPHRDRTDTHPAFSVAEV